MSECHDQARDLGHVRTAAMTIAARLGGSPAASDASSMVLSDLDSFSIVELVVALEDRFKVPLLPALSEFTGSTLDDLAQFVAKQAGDTGVSPL